MAFIFIFAPTINYRFDINNWAGDDLCRFAFEQMCGHWVSSTAQFWRRRVFFRFSMSMCVCVQRNSEICEQTARLLLLIASGGYNFENENRFALLKRITEWDCYVFSFIHIVQFFLSFCSVLRCISITIILICTMTNFTAHKIEYRICWLKYVLNE